jgi:hypothetical protein
VSAVLAQGDAGGEAARAFGETARFGGGEEEPQEMVDPEVAGVEDVGAAAEGEGVIARALSGAGAGEEIEGERPGFESACRAAPPAVPARASSGPVGEDLALQRRELRGPSLGRRVADPRPRLVRVRLPGRLEEPPPALRLAGAGILEGERPLVEDAGDVERDRGLAQLLPDGLRVRGADLDAA